MQLSTWGTQMTRPSGVSSILADIATARSSGGEWLNLGGGNPARIPEAVSTWQRLEGEALAEDFGPASSSYGPARGSDALVEAIVRYLNGKYGWGITAENVVVGPGSQMLCFIATTLFTGPGARAAVRWSCRRSRTTPAIRA